MTKAMRIFLAGLLVAGVAVSAQAESLSLRALEGSDFAATDLVRLPAEKGLLPGVSRDAVDFSYVLQNEYSFNGDGSLAAAPRAFVAESREYFVDVDAADLVEGVTIYTTAPGALLRINPAGGEKASAVVDPAGLTVKDAAGVEYGANEALDQIVSAQELKATGVPFAAGTVAFRLSASVDVGAVTIAAPALKSTGRFTVHVFDQASPIALKMGAGRADYLHGDRLTVEANFAGGAVKIGSVEGFVTSPAGRAWPLEMIRQGRRVVASLPLDAATAPGPGLWEVHLAARGQAGGLEVVRSVRTAFAAHMPTARLDGAIEPIRADDGLALRFGVEVGTPGRYEVRAVLYGSDSNGDLVPMSIGHAADWLDATGALVLRFPTREGLGGPYEVRDLRLMDQGRMGLLHRQARAVRLDR